jgi:hypothetical protein
VTDNAIEFLVALEQLVDARAALRRVSHHRELTVQAIPHRLFGGWAVDFHVGRTTRHHDDIDIAVRVADSSRVHTMLSQRGWDVVDEADGYRTYQRGGLRVDVASVDDDDSEWPGCRQT